ncbi:MAG: TetR/AcrR family transcriptional regulator [Sneathiella sp.]|nr:TetR/AcrR family transcriptional regulator [Sneathiella sp.]
MGNKSTRDHIVESADQLFYQQGFEHTSFADIAGVVKISRGNFYYHFKSKDEILDAVINLRLTDTAKMLGLWDGMSETPADRIRSFINILVTNRAKIKQHGCPVGTLVNELARLDHAAKSNASKIFSLFRGWLSKQFLQMGCGGESDGLAMHLLARSQGVASLATAFQDEAFIYLEVKQMNDWLDKCIKAHPLPEIQAPQV